MSSLNAVCRYRLELAFFTLDKLNRAIMMASSKHLCQNDIRHVIIIELGEVNISKSKWTFDKVLLRWSSFV